MVDYNAEPLVQVKDLCKYFQVGRHATLKAVDGVSFNIWKGETVGLVGESGCGKSTAGRCLIRLYEPTSGQVIFDGKDITKLSKAEQKEFCHRVQMIFQNPYASLNPRMTVRQTLSETIRRYSRLKGQSLVDRLSTLLGQVGLSEAVLEQYPREMSGGQCQRIAIARALATGCDALVADEPVSALDVSVQARVLNLLRDLRRELGISILLIAHDLAVVKNVCDRVAVMEKGRFVDFGEAAEVFAHPASEYTRRLLCVVPDVRRALEKRFGANAAT